MLVDLLKLILINKSEIVYKGKNTQTPIHTGLK